MFTCSTRRSLVNSRVRSRPSPLHAVCPTNSIHQPGARHTIHGAGDTLLQTALGGFRRERRREREKEGERGRGTPHWTRLVNRVSHQRTVCPPPLLSLLFLSIVSF
ncbi:hypothetical protein WMY93_017885 [Mugilogobius chulae]|uniref:Uncharacterized protein n=1 Tax=Mugilogobius chulae TaxID=88201 RepID=A0AAW0NHI1_9GOBI